MDLREENNRDPSKGSSSFSPTESSPTLSHPSNQSSERSSSSERMLQSGNQGIPQPGYAQHGMQMAAFPSHPYPSVNSLSSSSSSNLVADIPPPLPIPVMAVSDARMPVHVRSNSTSAGSTSGSSSDMMAQQYAGFNAMHTAMGISSGDRGRSVPTSRGTESSAKKSSSPEKTQGGDARAAQHGLTSTHPRLKVEDALGYLDQVKVIFAHKPKVYNDFLDIMKEFKSQSLDTPGVIGRVAQLFRGHNELIVGFNAFLPHGYKIDIDADKMVRVTLLGNQVVPLSDLIPPSPPPSHLSDSYTGSQAVKSQSPASTDTADSDDDEDTKMTEDFSRGNGHSIQEDLAASLDAERLSSLADLPGLGVEGGISSHGTTPSKGVEFDYAINYVNKIKNRFKDEPHRYKRFLEILHAYQGKVSHYWLRALLSAFDHIKTAFHEEKEHKSPFSK